MWDLIVSVPDHCLSFYFAGPYTLRVKFSSKKWSVTVMYGIVVLTVQQSEVGATSFVVLSSSIRVDTSRLYQVGIIGSLNVCLFRITIHSSMAWTMSLKC